MIADPSDEQPSSPLSTCPQMRLPSQGRRARHFNRVEFLLFQREALMNQAIADPGF